MKEEEAKGREMEVSPAGPGLRPLCDPPRVVAAGVLRARSEAGQAWPRHCSEAATRWHRSPPSRPASQTLFSPSTSAGDGGERDATGGQSPVSRQSSWVLGDDPLGSLALLHLL